MSYNTEAWKSKDPEGDSWSEHVICFPSKMPLEKVFTKENIIKLYQLEPEDIAVYEIEITFNKNPDTGNYSYVNVYMADPEDENDIYCDTDFVDTAGALVLAEVEL